MKIEKTLYEKVNFKHLNGVFGMFLLFGILKIAWLFVYVRISRSSHQRCSVKKGVLVNFAKFIGKHLCQRLFFKKKSFRHMCFPLNFPKFLRTPFLQNTSEGCFWIRKLNFQFRITHSLQKQPPELFCNKRCSPSKKTFFTEHVWTSASKWSNFEFSI